MAGVRIKFIISIDNFAKTSRCIGIDLAPRLRNKAYYYYSKSRPQIFAPKTIVCTSLMRKGGNWGFNAHL